MFGHFRPERVIKRHLAFRRHSSDQVQRLALQQRQPRPAWSITYSAELDTSISAHAGSDAAARLLNRLATPQQLTLEATNSLLQKRKDQLAAKQRLEEAERDLDAKTAAVKPSIADMADVISETFSKELTDAKSDIGKAARHLGLDRLEGKPQELLAAVDTLAKQAERGRGLRQALLFRLGGWRPLLLLFSALLLFPFGVVAFKQFLADTMNLPWVADVSATRSRRRLS